MNYKKLVFCLVPFLFTVQAVALTVVPAYQKFTLKKGKMIVGEFKIVNNEGSDIKVTPKTKNWFVLPENEAIDVKEWLEVDSTEFVLKKGESKTISFSAKAPKKAKGELIGMVSFLTKSKERTSVNFMMSSAVYVVIKGTEKIDGRIKAISVIPSENKVEVGVLVENKGNVHVRPAGTFKIFDKEGNPLANVELEKGFPTYPGKTHSYAGVVTGLTLAPGKYTGEISLFDIDWREELTSRKTKFKVGKNFKVKLR